MLKRECKGLESRIELADELVQQYKDKIVNCPLCQGHFELV